MEKDKKVGFDFISLNAKIEILKDEERLIYTATIIDLNENYITFIDKFGKTYSFNHEVVKQITYLEDKSEVCEYDQ